MISGEKLFCSFFKGCHFRIQLHIHWTRNAVARYLLKNQDKQKITTDNTSRTRKLSGECTLALQSAEEHRSPKEKRVLLEGPVSWLSRGAYQSRKEHRLLGLFPAWHIYEQGRNNPHTALLLCVVGWNTFPTLWSIHKGQCFKTPLLRKKMNGMATFDLGLLFKSCFVWTEPKSFGKCSSAPVGLNTEELVFKPLTGGLSFFIQG